MTPHVRSERLAATGYAVLRRARALVPAEEFEGLTYLPWRSGGDTNFAPLASATGELDCGGPWHQGKADKDGVWTDNARRCPSIVRWVASVGARFGRVRVIRLQPQDYEGAVRCLHQDDNNRANPPGEGWVVRAWLELTHDPESFLLLRDERDDAAGERRIALPAGAQFVVDSERLHHAVCHVGTRPRYAVIASFESGPALDAWIARQTPEAPTRRLPARAPAARPLAAAAGGRG